MALNDKGHEILDSKPMAVPIDFRRPPTIAEQIKMMVRGELSRQAASQGQETWEEADDFDVDDDPELRTKYELDDEQDGRGLREFIEEAPNSQKAEPVASPAKPAPVPEGGKTENPPVG